MKSLQPRVAPLGSRVATIQPGGWRTSGQTSAQRGYGWKWQQARERHLKAHPLCAMCEAEGLVTQGNVVDHIVPHRGDQALFWDRSNWQTLCSAHHSSAKQREENAGLA